ncbi:MAG: type II toxin-antitoxin system prevent-host-death family antitoxin [Alphaproteobacteria bacterium]|nr:type II toxin-antitoxin system prevent-host-death family antitoxin [Alphaproteobacteria bacterium]
MKIDFKTLKMMELRSSPGEVLDRVARDGEVFIVEHNGEPKACLVPVSYLLPDISPSRIAKELNKLNEKSEIYKLMITEAKELEISFQEAVSGEAVLLRIVLPHGYPNYAPRIFADNLPADTPNRRHDRSLSIFGVATTWNAKSNDVFHVLRLARGWLRQYSKWRKTGVWPERMDA